MTGEEYAKRVIAMMKMDDPYQTVHNMLVAAFNFGAVEGMSEAIRMANEMTQEIKLEQVLQ